MQSQNHGLISRSSSATLSLVERPSYVPEGSFDDLVITQGLLDGSKNLSKRISFHEVPAGLFSYGGSIGQDDSSDSQNAAPLEGRTRRGFGTSNTWTSSSGDMVSEQDEIDDRSVFIQEYNRLAKKHGVRSMVVEDFPSDNLDPYDKPWSWFSRKILRKTSSSQSIKIKTDRPLRHKRSISDLSLRPKSKNDKLKDKDLQELVRLCGSSLLYLPSEYAVASLAVPTCFRATAQYLVQHAPTAGGIFRIPGSHGTVALLYNHFCALDEGGDIVSGTVRCPKLPEHISCDVHDVASAFKKFISGLPGGILGSLRLFDSLISIQTQLHSDPELTRTKQSKVRARLVALAIYTLKSQHRRELICAVFGLLCMIGRAAETSKREDDRGRPLPTSDLMGYRPLGIVFGPLLVGDLLESYTMRLANPHGGLILLPISPPKSRKERQKEKQKAKTMDDKTNPFNTFVDKIKVANGVTEMLITHWRDVVRHMKSLKALKPLASHKSLTVLGAPRPFLRPSASDTFAIRKPPDWDDPKSTSRRIERSTSPTPVGRTSRLILDQSSRDVDIQTSDILNVRKQRSKSRPISNNFLTRTRSLSILSPTTEEKSREECGGTDEPQPTQEKGLKLKRKEHERSSLSSRHSKLSRKDGSTDNPSKLRKAHPAQQKKDVKDSPISKLNKGSNGQSSSSHSKEEKSGSNKKNQGEITNQKHLSHFIKPGLLNATSKLLQAGSAVNIPKDAHVPEGMVSRQIRRIAASEPSQNSIFLASPRRLVSKSLNVDVLGRGKTFNGKTRSKDPLSLISQKEDLASLKALAQAIEYEDARVASRCFDGAFTTPNKGGSLAGSLRRNAIDSRFHDEYREVANSSTTLKASSQKKASDRTSSTSSTHGLTFCETKNSSHDTVIKSPPLCTTPKHITATPSPIKRFGSPGHNVKALAAKFNTAESTHVFESPTKISPIKTLAKIDSPSQSRRDSLVAPYTTNSPSPTRSQRSVISEKTPQLSRKPHGELCTTPQPVIVSVTKNLTPKASTIENPSLPPSHNEPPSLFKLITDVYSEKFPVHVLENAEIMARTFDGHGSFQTEATKRRSQSSLLTNHRGSDGPQITENYKSSASEAEVGDVTALEPTKSPHVHFAVVNLKASSGSGHSIDPIQTELQVLSSPAPSMTLSGTPLTHSCSVLHNKVRDLQKQLAVKSEEVRQLRQQLDARSNLDIGTLSEQLKEAKKEILAWKTRAEISEKQVEILSGRALGRSVSLKNRPEKPPESCAGHNEDGNKSPDNIQRTWHDTGMDGTCNSRDWNSEETTDTVIRDNKEGLTAG